MKLFENKVGRPSNETLKKRKMFKIGIVFSIVILIGFFFLLEFLGTSNLRGTSYVPGTQIELSKTKVYISAKSGIYLKRSGKFYIWGSEVSNGRIRVTKYKNRVGKKSYIAGWVKTGDIKTVETVDQKVISNYAPGDVDMNKKVEATDSRLILQYVSGLRTLNANEFALADVNKDGKVTAVDSRIVLQYVAGIKEIPTIVVKPAITITEYDSDWNVGSSKTVTVTLGDSSDSFKVETSNKNNMSITNETKTSFVLNALNQGKATIKVTSVKTGESISREYTIRKNANTSLKTISMTKFSDEWAIGAEGIATVTLRDSSDSFTVSSSNPKVMVVKATSKNQYKITSIEEGTTTITAISTKTGETVSYTYKVGKYQLPDISRFGANKKINLSETINGIPVYVENGCSTTNVNKFKNDIRNLESYATKPMKAIYIVKSGSYNTANPSSTSSAGVNHAGAVSYADIKCDNYYSQTLTHEAAHAIDYRYKFVAGALLSDNLKTQYNTYKPWNSTDPLREYSYTNEREFFADSYATYMGKTTWKFPDTLKNATKSTIDKVKSLSNW